MSALHVRGPNLVLVIQLASVRLVPPGNSPNKIAPGCEQCPNGYALIDATATQVNEACESCLAGTYGY